MRSLRQPPAQYVRSLVPVAEAMLHADRVLVTPFEAPLAESISKSDEDRIAEIVRRELKGKASEEYLVKVIRSVLTQLFKTFYTRRSFWRDSLNAHSD